MLTTLLLVTCFFSCSKESSDSYSNSSLQSVVVDISKETDADIMILNKDGSYAIYDSETKYGNGIVHFNTSSDNYFEDGITIIIGEDNLPKYAKIGDCCIFFSNFYWNTFDCAVIDENGDMSCYWNVPMDCFSDGILPEEYLTKAGLSDGVKIGMWGATKIALFAIAAVAAAPLIAAAATGTVASLGAISIASGVVALGSLAVTGYNEYRKSANPENYQTSYVNTDTLDSVGESLKWLNLKDGKLVFKMKSMKDWGLSMLTPILERIEVDLYQSIGQYEEKADDYFLNRDYQLQLESNIVECGPKESRYSVGIETKTAWTIDDSGVDKEWCSVSKGDGEIIINVKDYTESSEDRTCSAIIRSQSGQDNLVAPVVLIIKQSGVLFELSSHNFEFTQFAGNIAAYVDYNDRVTEWKVTSYPEWCEAYKYEDHALVVVVKDDKKLEATKVGIVTAMAKIKDGYTLDRTITVKRIPILTWDGTSWHFEPHLNISTSGDTGYAGGLDSFDISIQDEYACVFSTNGPWQSMQRDSDGRLTFHYKHSESFSQKIGDETFTVHLDESASMNVSRIDEMHAYATLSGHGTISGDASGSVSVSGSVTGTRTDKTKAGDREMNGCGRILRLIKNR